MRPDLNVSAIDLSSQQWKLKPVTTRFLPKCTKQAKFLKYTIFSALQQTFISSVFKRKHFITIYKFQNVLIAESWIFIEEETILAVQKH